MGKTFSRNPEDQDHYCGNVKRQRKSTKHQRAERHMHEEVLVSNIQADQDYGNHTDNFLPRKDDW